MRLLFDFAVVVPIILLALGAEPYIKGSANRVLAMQILVKIVTFGLIGCAFFLESRIPPPAVDWPRECGLFIWFSVALFGQVFIILAIIERRGQTLKRRAGRRFLQIARSLQSTLRLDGKKGS
jgi:hypothetical protein